jgi:DNA primase
VSPVKQFYHCFGCGAHGTAISFLMNYDRLEFLDAVEELARRAGIEVPRDTRTQNEDGESRELYAALEASAKFFQQQLAGSARAQAYLDKRGVDADNRARFSIGYAPEGFNGLKDALGTDERKMKLLEKAGLFSKNEAGRIYDKFRDRVMFPIHDRRGRVIAFGGRAIPINRDHPDRENQNAAIHGRTSQKSDDGPKYLNSPETELFHKGRELYGLWQVRQAHAKIPRLIVVEGYMDVVALFQYGVTQAVATLGTATTPDHAELLFRNAGDVYFCFDGDRAGRGAAWKAVESILPRMKDGRQAYFLFLPEGEDPDSIVRQEGAAGFDARLNDAMPLSEFFFAEVSKDVKLSSLDGKARLAERAKPMLAQIPDGAFLDLMQQRLSEITGIGARNVAEPAPPVRSNNRRAAPAPKRSLVRTAIALLLQQPSLAEAIEPPHLFAALRQPGIPLLVELVALARARPGISTGAILEHFAEREEFVALKKLASQGVEDITSAVKADFAVWDDEQALATAFQGALSQLDKQTRQQRVDELNARRAEVGMTGLSDSEKAELRELQIQR